MGEKETVVAKFGLADILRGDYAVLEVASLEGTKKGKGEDTGIATEVYHKIEAAFVRNKIPRAQIPTSFTYENVLSYFGV